MSDDAEGLGASYAGEVAADEAAKRPPLPPQQEGTAAAATDENSAAFDLGAPEVAVLVWEVIDVALCKFAGADMALTPDERRRLVPPTVKVLEKHMGAVKLSPEWALAATAGTIYVAKLAAAGALPGFGAARAPSSAAEPAPQSTTTNTAAAVDGKPVAATVVHFQKGTAS